MKHFFPLLLWAIPVAALSQQECPTTISIHNKIKPKMLEYTFLKVGYSPDSFKLKVNGNEVKPGSSISVPNNQKMLIVRYDYSFAKGWRTGAKEITFELNPKNKDCDLEFSWNNEWRVMASGAKPQKVKRVKYHPS